MAKTKRRLKKKKMRKEKRSSVTTAYAKDVTVEDIKKSLK